MTTRPGLIEQINTLTSDIRELEQIYGDHFPEPSEQLDRMNMLMDARQALIVELRDHITPDEMTQYWDKFIVLLGRTPKTYTYEKFTKSTDFWVVMPELIKG